MRSAVSWPEKGPDWILRKTTLQGVRIRVPVASLEVGRRDIVDRRVGDRRLKMRPAGKCGGSFTNIGRDTCLVHKALVENRCAVTPGWPVTQHQQQAYRGHEQRNYADKRKHHLLPVRVVHA